MKGLPLGFVALLAIVLLLGLGLRYWLRVWLEL
jgi:hypothetical protein